MIHKVSFTTGVAAGSAGSATSTAYSAFIRGKILAVDVVYNDSPPGTTDVTISDTDGSAEAVLTLTNAATDGRFYPRIIIDGVDGAAIASNYDYFVVAGMLKAVIAGADAGDSASIVVFYED